ncbi:MAG: quinolinate synthase NadA [bacterium]
MSSLQNKIQSLKKKHNAVILVHNYQIPEVQDIADYLGDSLGLSQQAAKTNADVIVFCGVHFMAETAKILSPDKKVIMPDANAGCPMAEMITAKDLAVLKTQNPKATVVTYVNSTAEVKALSDICCTSGNAVKVVQSIENEEIVFVPDMYLGQFVASKIRGKKFIFARGYCPTHAKIMPEHIKAAKEKHPKAKVIVHPECRPETIAAADEALSTSGMVKFARESGAREILVGTEVGMIYALQKQNPDKMFYPVLDRAVCPNMKLTTLEKVLWSLEELKTEITVPEDIADQARGAVERMVAIV